MSTPKKYKVEYKVLNGDTYDKLSLRYGATLLANAGIYGDEDIQPNSTITFRGLNEDEVNTVTDKTKTYLGEYNRNQDLNYIKQNRDYLDELNWWQGNSSYGKSDEELLSTFRGTVAAGKKEEADREAYIKEREERSRNYVSTPGQFDRYHTGRKDWLTTNGNKGIFGRGLTLNGNTGLSYTESRRNFEDLQQLGKDIYDLTNKAAFGIVTGAALASNAAMLTLLGNGISTAGKTAGNVISKAGNAASKALQPVTKPVGKFVWDIVSHPVENFIAPQLASKFADKGLQYTNEKGWTDLDEKERELISTAIGFGAGLLGVGMIKTGISKGINKAGLGHLYESGSKYAGLLEHQLRNKYMSLGAAGFNPVEAFTNTALKEELERQGKNATLEILKQQSKNLATHGITNFAEYGIPALAPAYALYKSYNLTGRTLGENIEHYTGLNAAVGDMLAEGVVDGLSGAYKHGLAYAQSTMSGGKKGFRENWKYFINKSGKTNNGDQSDFLFTIDHPLLAKINAFRKAIMLSPGNNNYQMATIESTGKLKGSTSYVANKQSLVSPLLFVKYWFSGDDADLGELLEKRGTIMLGNRDTSTGNALERLAKGVGGLDGRFEVGQRANIVTTPGDNVEKVLQGALFLNLETRLYEPMFLKSGELNPNLKKGTYGSRNNVLLGDAVKSEKGFKGTMLDIDGHLEIRIKTEDGKYAYVNIDLIGPGSGGTGGGVAVKSLSNTVSREMIPTYSITLGGPKQVRNPKEGLGDLAKIMLPFSEASDVDDFVLSLENLDNPYIKAGFGNTDEYKRLAEYAEKMKADRKLSREKGKEYKKSNITDKQITALEAKLEKELESTGGRTAKEKKILNDKKLKGFKRDVITKYFDFKAARRQKHSEQILDGAKSARYLFLEQRLNELTNAANNPYLPEDVIGFYQKEAQNIIEQMERQRPQSSKFSIKGWKNRRRFDKYFDDVKSKDFPSELVTLRGINVTV